MRYGGRAVLLMASWGLSTFALAGDINGRWLTIDADSGAKRSTVEITRTSGHFIGRIVELFLNADEPSDPVCDLCPGARRGQRLRGMEILFLDQAPNGIGYAGRILDPEEGRFYECTVTLDAAGKRLSIRGYVGIPLLGRSVTWERAEQQR